LQQLATVWLHYLSLFIGCSAIGVCDSVRVHYWFLLVVGGK